MMTWQQIEAKTKTLIFGYRESFLKFYRNLEQNKNGYSKYIMKSVEKIENRYDLGIFCLFPKITIFIWYFNISNEFDIF